MSHSENRRRSHGNAEDFERRQRYSALPAGTPEAPRSTTIIYLLALCIIAGISITSHYLTNRIVAQQESTALLVNTAGRQRMLSQRIIVIAEGIADGSLDPDMGRNALGTLADRMETAEHQLTLGDVPNGMPAATSPQLRAIYFGSPVRLENQVNNFLAHTRAFASKARVGMADADLRAMISAASAPC